MKRLHSFWSTSFVLLGVLVGCNLHSGSGLDPDELLEGGASGIEGDGGSGGSSSGAQSSSGSGGGAPFTDAGATGGSSGGNQSGNSSGGSGSSSGGDGVDAGLPPPQDASTMGNPGQCPVNPSTCVDCCGTFDPAGYQAFLNAIAPCLCGDGNGDVCSAACVSEVCVDQPYSKQNDACETCVNTNGGRTTTCFMQARQACQIAGTCTMFMGCYGGCPAGSQ